jgi:citrate lyase subunit beta/citryl-CoA lyase
MLARRAVLSVPATSARMLAKSATLDADEIVIDLEDSVPDSEKTDETRRAVVTAVEQLAWRAPRLAVRVNGYGSPWFERDISGVVGPLGDRVSSVVVPKVETPKALEAARSELEAARHAARLQALIETALGLVRVETIGASADATGTETLIFGPGDYAASLGVLEPTLGGIDDRYPGDQWHYARSRIAVTAHAFGLEPIDGPYAAFTDDDGLETSALRARLLGFTGKWAIHPRQVALLTAAFTPGSDEIARARSVVDALDKAAAEGDGAVKQDGAMIDAASVRMARRTLACTEDQEER